MLAAVVVLSLSQFIARDGVLYDKLMKEVYQRGWVAVAHGHPTLGAHLPSVGDIVAYGNHRVRITVDAKQSSAGAAKELALKVRTKEERTPLDEAQLKGTGLKVDVLDYKNKRLSSLRAYAASNLRIFGVVKNSFILIVAEPHRDGDNGEPPNAKSEEAVYQDEITFAKLIVEELNSR